MIQAVLTQERHTLPKLPKMNNLAPKTKKGGISLADSFVKNTLEEAPVISGTSLAVSFIQAENKKAPLSKILKNNTKNIFLPVLLISSAVTAVFENYITDEINGNTNI